MKSKVQKLKSEVISQTNLRKQAEISVSKYKHISRTYWERWRWELHKRREALQKLVMQNKPSTSQEYLIHEIDPTMLKDPLVDGKHKETYLARGCFGIVRLQKYRQMQVHLSVMLRVVGHPAHALFSALLRFFIFQSAALYSKQRLPSFKLPLQQHTTEK